MRDSITKPPKSVSTKRLGRLSVDRGAPCAIAMSWQPAGNSRPRSGPRCRPIQLFRRARRLRRRRSRDVLLLAMTLDRLLISSLMRSNGFVDHTFCRCARGNPVNASKSGLASSIEGPTLGNIEANWLRTCRGDRADGDAVVAAVRRDRTRRSGCGVGPPEKNVLIGSRWCGGRGEEPDAEAGVWESG